MEENHNEHGRRSYLKKLGGMVGVSSIPTFNIPGTSSQTTIPIAKRKDDVVVRKRVPKNWFEQIEHARNALEEAQERYNGQFTTIGLTPVDNSVKGRRKMGIKMRVDNNSTLEEIPNEINGISSTIVEEEITPQSWPCHGGGPYSSLPGGSQINNGSACCRVIDNSGKYYLLTAHHVVASCSSPNAGGNEVTHAGNRIGYVNEWHPTHDWAGILRDNNNGIYFNNKI